MEAQQPEAETLRDLIDRRSDLKALLKHPGWKIIQEYLERNKAWRVQKIISTPLGYEGSDGTWTSERQEYMKGEIAGFEITRVLPESLLGDVETEIAEQENEDAD